MKGVLAGVALTALLVPAIASGQDATAPAKTTVQQDFEAATRLAAGDDAAATLAAWQALERRVANNPRSLAIVRLRKAQALLKLNRRDEAAESAQAGLAAIPTDDPSLVMDRYDAHLTLGRISEAALDYATALDHYRSAYSLAPSIADKVIAWRGFLETATFMDPDAALGIAGEFDAFAAGARLEGETKGILETKLSQLYLNLGRYEDARRWAKQAVDDLGGLTTRVKLNDVAARSNYTLAALRLDERTDARRYMAYTGAGRATEGRFRPPAQMIAPDCGGEAGLRPDDVAVIEFSVGNDGSVIDSAPVWASRSGPIALEFARAARDWSWTPEALEKLPPFFRSRTRVEMRCSTEFARPSVWQYGVDALTAWLEAKGAAATSLDGSDAAQLPRRRAELARLDAAGKGTTIAAVPVLWELATNEVSARGDSHQWAVRALEILRKAGAPPLARLAVEGQIWLTEDADRASSDDYAERLAAALRDPIYASDAEARGTLALLYSDAIRLDE